MELLDKNVEIAIINAYTYLKGEHKYNAEKNRKK